MSLSRMTTLTLALAAFAIVAADVGNARVGGGGSFGSRGSRTYSAPPATNTAPKAAPMERSMTEKSAPTSAQNAQPGAGAAQPSRFGGWRGLLMGGLIGAGLASIFGFGPRDHSGWHRAVCAACVVASPPAQFLPFAIAWNGKRGEQRIVDVLAGAFAAPGFAPAFAEPRS